MEHLEAEARRGKKRDVGVWLPTSAEEPRSRGCDGDLEREAVTSTACRQAGSDDRGQQRQDLSKQEKGHPGKPQPPAENDRMGQGGTEMKQKIQKSKRMRTTQIRAALGGGEKVKHRGPGWWGG